MNNCILTGQNSEFEDMSDQERRSAFDNYLDTKRTWKRLAKKLDITKTLSTTLKTNHTQSYESYYHVYCIGIRAQTIRLK